MYQRPTKIASKDMLTNYIIGLLVMLPTAVVSITTFNNRLLLILRIENSKHHFALW